MGRFPFNVAGIETKFILFLLVIENESIILMGQTFYVFVQQKLNYVVLLAVKAKEIF
jgi:hypothetical protein